MSPTGKAFYVTTPIYYVNDAPHIGHAYTTVAADVLTRWHRQRGERVWFLTGTDEHGAEGAPNRAGNGVTPQEWADRLVAEHWRPVLETLDVANDDFIRTTERASHAARAELPDPAQGRRAHLPRRLRGSLLRRLRGVQAARRPGARHRAVRRPAGVPDPRPPGRDRVGDQLVLPAVGVRRAAAGALRRAPGRRRAGERPQRGRVVHPRRPARPVDLPVHVRLGHPGALGPLPGRLRVVRRPAQLRHGGRARRRAADAGRRDVRQHVAGRRPPGRQGHPAVPRGDLAGDADGGGAAAARAGVRPRLAAGRRREDEQVQADRDRPRADHRPLRRRTPSATTSCARSSSARTGRSRGRT